MAHRNPGSGGLHEEVYRKAAERTAPGELKAADPVGIAWDDKPDGLLVIAASTVGGRRHASPAICLCRPDSLSQAASAGKSSPGLCITAVADSAGTHLLAARYWQMNSVSSIALALSL